MLQCCSENTPMRRRTRLKDMQAMLLLKLLRVISSEQARSDGVGDAEPHSAGAQRYI